MALNESIFTNEERDDLIQVYRARLDKLLVQFNDVKEEISRVTGVLAKLGHTELTPITDALVFLPDDKPKEIYRENWSWTLKIKYALKQIGRCVPTREIIDELLKLESSLNPTSAINSVSSTISTKAAKGFIFKRYQPYPGSEYYTGLAEWFDDGNKVKPQYKGD